MEKKNMIELAQYRKAEPAPSSTVSKELEEAIQVLILRLRESRPIKKTAS